MRITTFSLLSLATLIALPNAATAQSADRHPLYEPALAVMPGASDSSNLFAGAKVTASGHYGNDKPELAVNGKTQNPNEYWGCENLPVWYQVDMGAPRQLSSLHVWPYWQDGRIYKYIIEGSLDGQSWKMLVDQGSNSIASTAAGVPFKFEPQELRYVKVTFLDNSRGKKSGGHLVEIKGYAAADTGLNAAALKDYVRLPHGAAPTPDMIRDGVTLNGWRGERVNAQIAVWTTQAQEQVSVTCAGLKNAAGAQRLPVNTGMVRYTKGAGQLHADIIGKESVCSLPDGGARPVWISVDIPAKAKPGVYKGTLQITSLSSKAAEIPVTLTVDADTLPAQKQIHLDLWQHPQAVARWHDVEPWSPEHFAIMKPLMKRLADAGQKAISCSLIDEAWNEQTYDWWPSMIDWIKGKDGKMRWNYANFDKWVTFMLQDVGIRGQISCYTMVPWNLRVRYLDEATGKYKLIPLKPGDPSYEAVWGPFLTDFRKHVKAKGWLDKTCIALDERPDHMVKAAMDVINKYAPEFKVVSAVNVPSKQMAGVYDISPSLQHANTVMGDLVKKRRAEGKKTTFYVCCGPMKPNTFTFSPLAESEWLPLFSAANNLDGFLRWAYNSWPRNPFETTDFGTWPTGDTFLVYPGNLSSLRFEKLRDGIEEFEKVLILRARAAKTPQYRQAVERMDKELSALFTVQKSNANQHESDVLKAKALIRSTAKATSAK